MGIYSFWERRKSAIDPDAHLPRDEHSLCYSTSLGVHCPIPSWGHSAMLSPAEGSLLTAPSIDLWSPLFLERLLAETWWLNCGFKKGTGLPHLVSRASTHPDNLMNHLAGPTLLSSAIPGSQSAMQSWDFWCTFPTALSRKQMGECEVVWLPCRGATSIFPVR